MNLSAGWFGRTSLLLVIVMACGLMAAGCSRNYVLTLQNGARITTHGKPKLQNGAYVFKDAAGKPAYVPAGKVREISPASMARQEKTRFDPSKAR